MCYKDRLKKIEKLLPDIKKEQIEKSDARKFAHQILSEMNAEFVSAGKKSTIDASTLKNAEKTLRYLDNQGASLKSILEYLMLSLPKI